MALKYKVGDRVRIKDIDWYNDNKDKDGNVDCGFKLFTYEMSKFCGYVMTVRNRTNLGVMTMVGSVSYWTDEMIEGLVEEETPKFKIGDKITNGKTQLTILTILSDKYVVEDNFEECGTLYFNTQYDWKLVEEETVHNKWPGLKVELELSKSVIGVSNVESLHGERFMSGFVKAIIPPEGYIFKDENGNVINTTKIVLEKKEKEYPKTYEECCKVMGVNHTNDLDICEHCDYKTEITYYEDSLLEKIETLYRLIICRDAYWQIAGDEMGLENPWEPDWKDDTAHKFIIYTIKDKIHCGVSLVKNHLLAFPNEEMRDEFFKNFKSEIEICKELLS